MNTIVDEATNPTIPFVKVASKSLRNCLPPFMFKYVFPFRIVLPTTFKVAIGEVVPIPTFPPAVAKYAEPVEPICVVLANPKVLFPVQVFVSANKVVLAPLLLPPLIHVPLTAKQPVRRFIPVPNVEVAAAEILIVFAPVSPIERMVPGVVVPIPTYPFEATSKAVEVAKPFVEDASAKSGAVPPAVAWTESAANGDEVPIPSLPSIERRLETVKLLEVMFANPESEVISELAPECAGAETVQSASVGPQAGFNVSPGT
jgi:hypothetical protein